MEPPGKIVFEVDPIVTFDTIIGLSYDNILFSASLNTSLKLTCVKVPVPVFSIIML